MRDKLWHIIWKTGRLVCPLCYHRLWDSVTYEDYVEWRCHHCEIETDEPECSLYWPFDIIRGRISYWVYMQQKKQED